MKTQLNHLLFILFVAFIINSYENTIKLSLLFYFFQFMYFLRAVFFFFQNTLFELYNSNSFTRIFGLYKLKPRNPIVIYMKVFADYRTIPTKSAKQF